MQPELIIQGEQLLYTNQFDQLTYNADHLVELASQIDKILKNFSYCFPSKDFLHIINKNSTPFIYWLTIDALYFSSSYNYELNRTNYIRRQKNSNRSSSSQLFEQEKLITKMRSLALINKKYSNLQQIKGITTDELIQFFQKEHKNVKVQNDQILDNLVFKLISQKQRFNQKLQKLNVDYVQTSPLLSYYKFDKQMIRTWMDQAQRKKNGFKCQICNKFDNKLIKCQNCDLIIHSQCYAKLGKNYKFNQFICQNCQKELNQKTCCIFCPRKGGYFLQIQCLSQRKCVYKISKQQNNLKLKLVKTNLNERKLFVHLSCSLWHPDLEYSQKQNKLINIHRIDRNKSQNICFQCGTNMGITIPCADANCRRFYHAQCAHRIPLTTCITNAKNQLPIQLYCQRHSRCHIYQFLKQNILLNLKAIKTFVKSINQISRMRASNHHVNESYRKYQQINQRYDYCIYCRIGADDLCQERIVNCWKCYNWYHQKCGIQCNNCDVLKKANV